FNLNVPTRVGFQTPFTNLTFDLKPSKLYAKSSVIIGGKPQDDTYEEFHKEMSMINRAFCELMMEGDAKGRIFTFPIPTYNITKDFDWDNPDYEPLWEMTRKYGIPYFSNFVNSDMDPEDAFSMCCRLKLDKREIKKRGGGLFGANPLTGSIGVVTINLPRLGYLSTCEEEFFERLEALMELAKTSLEIKRKVIEDFTEKGLYPYSKVYLENVKKAKGSYWANHFATIGIIGMNEACLNFLNTPIYTPEGKEFALKVLKFMCEKIAEFKEETGNLYNLEATPAEGTSYRLAKIDKTKFPRIKTQGTPQVPYYTNSVHLPVNYTDDIFEILTHQDDLQIMFTGGTVVHLYVGEEIPDSKIIKELVKSIVENFRLPYFSITPTFSVCPVHGYIPGKHEICPYPHTEEDLEKYGVEIELPITMLSKLPKEAYKEI
ncbi:MAG: ribonucleoside triphosphate reductase, partial [Thermodesulfobacteriota bacterium]